MTRVFEEEWSYIPVGGPLPLASQTVTAFGAAANLVHPATGYSIARSLREAPDLAASMAAILRRRLPVQETAEAVWNSLWPAEKRRQVRAHIKIWPDIWALLMAGAQPCLFGVSGRAEQRRRLLFSDVNAPDSPAIAILEVCNYHITQYSAAQYDTQAPFLICAHIFADRVLGTCCAQAALHVFCMELLAKRDPLMCVQIC